MVSDTAAHTLWCHIREVKMMESFYRIYMHTDKVRANIISGFLCIASVSGVASFFSNLPSWICGSIVFVSSMLSAINHLFPFNKRAARIALIMPEFELLINSVLHTWDTRGDLSDREVSEAIYGFRNEFARLESKYLGPGLPHPRWIVEKAQAEADDYLNYTLKGGVEDEEPEPSIAAKNERG